MADTREETLARELLTTLCESGDKRVETLHLFLERAGVLLVTQGFKRGVNTIVSFGTGAPLLITAHVDSVPGTPGANDNGAAVVSLFLLADRLTRERCDRAVTLLFADQEEQLCLGSIKETGSTFYGENLLERPRLSLVLDMCGSGDTLCLNTFSDTKENIDRLVSGLGVEHCVRDFTTPCYDHTCLARVGVSTTLLCTLPLSETRRERYPTSWRLMHTENDKVETVDIKTVLWLTDRLTRLVENT